MSTNQENGTANDAKPGGSGTNFTNGYHGGRSEDKPAGDAEAAVSCGLGAWRPNCIQKCANAKLFCFVLAWFMFFEGLMYSGFFKGAITSLEKQFRMPSSVSGTLATVAEITAVVVVTFVTYPGADSLDLELNPYGHNLVFSSRYYQLLGKRKGLPIYACKEVFMTAMRKSQVVLVEGKVGSGKTTQIPQWCAEFVHAHQYQSGIVGCAEPADLVTCSVAQRVADEMDLVFGEEVGYCTALEDFSTQETILRFVNDSVLLREIAVDPLLERYGVIILDEVQRRTVATDLTMALLGDILSQRSDMRVVVVTTSIQAGNFQSYIGACEVVKVPGAGDSTTEIHHTQDVVHDGKCVEEAVKRVTEIHANDGDNGDILVFLADEKEVQEACKRLREVDDLPAPLHIIPVFPSLSHNQLQGLYDVPDEEPEPTDKGLDEPLRDEDTPEDVVENDGSDTEESGTDGDDDDDDTISGERPRKVIVATDIADSCLVVDTVGFVVDSGRVRQEVFNARVRATQDLVSLISRLSADQRADLASLRPGRPGKCFRLYPQDFMEDLAAFPNPEIHRVNLTPWILLLKRLGVEDLLKFDFPDPPATEFLSGAMNQLKHLDAVDETGCLTDLGAIMSEFPVDPQLARTIIASCEYGCCEDILTIAALLTDFGAILERLELGPCEDSEPKTEEERVKNIKRALAEGYFMQVAHDLDGTGNYFIVKETQVVQLHPTTCLDSNPGWVLYHEFVLSERNYITTLTEIEPQWLFDIAPKYFDPTNLPQGEARRRFHSILVKSELAVPGKPAREWAGPGVAQPAAPRNFTSHPGRGPVPHGQTRERKEEDDDDSKLCVIS
ncbi:PREDICTED: probable pre-mRNA-splicing factor ATP-dependent RNA helicase DEAH2 [Branchiostoma belcheri]|uniref:RNA helicase n=1 Tax=Branchiostoma belcheri TaxID=7741 RepID=A0A6P4Y978_BRABE|nr:PREDICTED: probable pre-mRNA-splicing factor ATP-dependent RNA helicase DEAH2 [Branchiostoma belcheri]